MKSAAPSAIAVATPPSDQDNLSFDYTSTPLAIAAAGQTDLEIVHEGGAIVFNDSVIETTANQPVIGVAFHRNEVNPIRMVPGDVLAFKRRFRRIYITWKAGQTPAGNCSLIVFPVGVVDKMTAI